MPTQIKTRIRRSQELSTKYKELYEIADQILMDVSNQWEEEMGANELDELLEPLRRFMMKHNKLEIRRVNHVK
jgi:hypothetical protein